MRSFVRDVVRSLVALIFLFNQGIDSFSVQKASTKPEQRSVAIWARAPPVSNFDLDAIEAFETKMDLEPLTAMKADDKEDDDDDEEENIWEDNNTAQEFTVPEELDGKRIDAALASLIVEPTTMSRSACGNLVAGGGVQLVQGEKKTTLDRKSFKVQAGTVLRVQLPKDETPVEIIPQNLPLNIIYEDEHMIVLNKAAGMVVHPATGNWDGTVVNALAYYLANESPYGSGDFVGSNLLDENTDPTGADGETVSFRPGVVHRLDKGTTGVLVVAKTTHTLAELSSSFAARTVKKTYMAVTVGNPGTRATIDRPIGRHPVHRQRMRVVPDPHRKDSSGMAPKDRLSASPSQTGRRAVSHVDMLAFDGRLSVVQVRIETGRTHQIRVHLQDRHTPIYGDDVYGLSDWNKRLSKTHAIERPLLHAYRLEVDHPVSGERMVFTAPLAEDMKTIARAVWPSGQEERPELFE
jgi:23S rRNA pseudouridine1911/1915/1917 synthase